MTNRSRQPYISRDVPQTSGSIQSEALRRVIADQVGPRVPGGVYYDGPRMVRVAPVTTNPSEPRRILKRRAAQFAVEGTDMHSGDRYYTGAIWTGSDRVLKAVA